MSAPEWLDIGDDHQINLRLNLKVLTQIEQDIKELKTLNTLLIADREVIYPLDKQKLLKVFGSGVGAVSPYQGVIVIWTYYDDNSEEKSAQKLEITPKKSPVLRTVMHIDGDMTQKVRQNILSHPEADRILQAHGFAIAQISRQLTSAIADYLEEQIRPWVIATVSSVATYTWGESFLHLPPNQLWLWAIAIFLGVLAIFLISSKLKFLGLILSGFTQKLSSKFSQKLGRLIRKIFDNPLCQFGAIAIILSALIGLILTKFAIGHPLTWIIYNINFFAEPYLPLAIVSGRKMIMSLIGKLIFQFPCVIQFIFERVIK